MPKPGTPKRQVYSEYAPMSRALSAIGDKWILLIVRTLLAGPMRFVEIRRALPRIPTDSLNIGLKRLVELQLVTRQPFKERPPRVEYELTDVGRDLVRVINELSIWGLKHCWGPGDYDEFFTLAALVKERLGSLKASTKAWTRESKTWCLSVLANNGAQERILITWGPEVSISVDFEGEAQVNIMGDDVEWREALAHRTPDGLMCDGVSEEHLQDFFGMLVGPPE